MAKRVTGSILALMGALGLFKGSTWDAWRVVLRAVFALPMTAADLEVYRRLTGRTSAPERPFREVWLIVGRRGGKSFVSALIAVYAVTCRRYALAPGEVGTFMIVAADRKQARVVKSYVAAMLRILGTLAEEPVETETAEQIGLRNGLRIEIVTASFRTIRGYTVIGCVADEIAFWQSDDSANPDTEILNALRPAMATQPDAVFVAITSPHARRGEAWRQYQKHFGKDEAPVLVVQADTATMNPAVPAGIIADAYADDPARASAEYGAQFRTDVESFVSLEVVEACRMPERYELAPEAHRRYVAFTDPSGGSSDAFTLAVAHLDGDRVVLDCLRERPAPFDPDGVVREFADVLRGYRVATIHGDRYAAEWPVERFRAHGITYRPAEKPKSDLYLALLPRLNAGTIDLLDSDKLVKQLTGLERRTARGGRETIDHAPNGHDDVANAVAGVSQLLARPQTVPFGFYRCEQLL